MEDLNKNQIVLLTLLVSFVTSIATGIMTASLLQEAPIEVTRNINSIVEKTIETVVPATPTTNQKEVTTVVVKEEDRIIESINKNVKSIVRIKERNPFTDESWFYGIGLVVSKDGLVVADRKTVLATNIYTAVLSDDTKVTLIPQGIDKQTNFILFKASLPEKSTLVFSPASISDAEPKLGQTLVALGGVDSNAVTVGRTISLDVKESGVGSSTVKYLNQIITDVATKDLVSGSPLFNLSGDIVGIRLTSDPLKNFAPSSLLKKEISVLSEAPAPSTKTQ
jgi:S1-C subfamily serine protease